jgi:hypothetical protein
MSRRSEELVRHSSHTIRVRHCVLWTLLAVATQACVGDDAPDDPLDSSNGAGGSKSAGAGGSKTAAGSGGSKSAAGSGGAGSGGASETLEAGSKTSHFPLVDGAKWTYHHENPTKAPWDEDATVVAGTYKDQPAFVMTDQEDAQGEQTSSTMQVQGTGVYRVYKEVAVSGKIALKTTYDPGFLRYDEAWVEGETVTLDDDWVQQCEFTSSAQKCVAGMSEPGSTKHSYTLISKSTEITVAAGTFDAVQVQRVNPKNSETKLFWFAAGVGKVRELDTGSNATEELTMYSIP